MTYSKGMYRCKHDFNACSIPLGGVKSMSIFDQVSLCSPRQSLADIFVRVRLLVDSDVDIARNP